MTPRLAKPRRCKMGAYLKTVIGDYMKDKKKRTKQQTDEEKK